VDARQEADKREILANADRNAEADLEMAKIQLIALVIGVGFNGLWWREQRRHFLNLAEAQQQALEAANQAEAARRQLAEAQGLAREVQDRMLAAQNLPREVHGQIQEAQNQMRAAQDEAREMQKQLQEFQNKVRETQAELEAARNRTLAAESKVLEAQNQAQSVRNLLEETRVQAREERAREERALEVQASLSQAETTRDQAQAANQQLQEAQSRVLELQEQARSAQAQLAEAREEVREAQAKILEAQQQAETARKQLEEIRNQAPPAQVVQSQTEEVLGEAVHDEAIRLQVQAAHDKLVEAESRVQELQYQTRTAQTLLEEARQQAREAQAKIAEAQNQAREAQDKVRGIQNQSRTARRLIRVFAVLAALSLLAASIAWRQRLAAGQAAPEVAAGTIDLSQIGSDRQPIQQVLENRQRSLDHLAAGIPQAEIPDALKASPVILSDQERSRFQKWLLIRLGWVNPASAMTSAAGIDGKIVNDAGSEDSACYFQLAVLDNWMRTDLAGAFHWACQLTDAVSRQHALEVIMQDPVRAVRLQQPIAGMPAGEAQNAAIHALLSTWAPVEPEKAANWLRAFSETNAQPEQVQYVVRVWAQRDPAAAAHWLATLPAGTADDGVASAFLAGAVASQPAFAWQWTESVSDETQRQKFQLQVIRQWLQADPLGYGLWSESRDLP
jgi:chemotaxis protein histidine kinase CheA